LNWSLETARLSFLASLVIILSFLFGMPFVWLFLATLWYLLWHVKNVNLLGNWLQQQNDEEPPPQSSGLWDDLFHGLYLRDKRAKLKYKRLQKRLRRFQESTTALPDATVILNRRGVIEWCNEAASRLLGLRMEQDIGQQIGNLVRNPRFLRYLEKGDYDEPIEMPSPYDETRTLMIRVVSYGRSQRLLIARDMTRLQRLEQMRRDFLSNFSHEMRTPLTVLGGYLETMNDSNDLNSWRDAIATMQQQVSRMQRINDDMLLLSRIENEELQTGTETIDVGSLLKHIVEEARLLSGERKHQIELQLESEANLVANRDELYSAFSNIIFNAVNYTPPGTAISVRWYEKNGQLNMEVEDKGEGFAEYHIPRLTERFYRVDAGRSRDSGGTGLGLAIVKHVLNRYGGRLHIYSRIGQGSTFTCIFPQASATP
jgi:two-component system phosphate regulon sensor histidine kinase PhoR